MRHEMKETQETWARNDGTEEQEEEEDDDDEEEEEEEEDEFDRWIAERLKRGELKFDLLEKSGRKEPSSNAQHWNGWGFADTKFFMDSNGVMQLSGNRYSDFFQAQPRSFPSFPEFAETVLGVDLQEKQECHPLPEPSNYPEPRDCAKFLDSLSHFDSSELEWSVDIESRLSHSHGHTCQEVYALRHLDQVPWSLPDLVLYPKSHATVEAIVAAAVKHKVNLIPFGGGTSVTMALNPPTTQEMSAVVSLDMRKMCAIRWIDRNNMTASIEAGAIGQDIEEKLNKLGLTLGHMPDSSEFSSLGGWIATKSSGMKKNVYGNIEDIVLDVKMVTPGAGTLQRGSPIERVSVGPDAMAMAIGSEGTLGVITEAVVRLRLKPAVTKYESYVFADFRHGVSAMREIALQRVAPASVRLMDNTQFKMGQALKPPVPRKGRWKHELIDRAKKYYVTEYHGYDPDELCAMVLLFEGGDSSQIKASQAAVDRICAKYGGIRAGAESGVRGYFLTFMIAYLRDFGLDHGFLSESFETSVKWSDVLVVYERVRERILKEAAALGVETQPLVGGRVTQTYDTSAAMYFYFGILKHGLENPVETFSKIEHAAREEILSLGGSLSHHHGVGKLRKAFYPLASTRSERNILRAVKNQLDPTNVFGAANIGYLEGNDEDIDGSKSKL